MTGTFAPLPDAALELHVAVANAIGWTDLKQVGGILLPGTSYWQGRPPGSALIVGRPEEGLEPVPRFDVDWGPGGKLIETYRLAAVPQFTADGTLAQWVAFRPGARGAAFGETPLAAACGIVLVLAAAGKL